MFAKAMGSRSFPVTLKFLVIVWICLRSSLECAVRRAKPYLYQDFRIFLSQIHEEEKVCYFVWMHEN